MVNVSWEVAKVDGDRTLHFRWQETGGPPPLAPQEHGFGTALLKSAVPNVRLDYAPAGLVCEFDFLARNEEKVVALKTEQQSTKTITTAPSRQNSVRAGRDPNGCREHAKRCQLFADRATTDKARETYLSLAKTWLRLATEVERSLALLGRL
jgi:hypothetical protein